MATNLDRAVIGVGLTTLLAIQPGFCPRHLALAQGIVPPGAGPVLRSFGGTAIAAPLDAIGALYWNPATLSFLGNRLDTGAEAVWTQQTVTSTIPANVLGPGNPPTALTGKTPNDIGVTLGPAAAMLTHLRGKWSKLSVSGGVFPYSGGGTNYPADPANPTLAGLGGFYTSFVIITFPVAAAYKFSDHFSAGIAIDPATAVWSWSRAIFAHPDTGTLNGKPVVQFPAAITDPSYGIGVHAGAYYHNGDGLGLGLMIKSPIFFQRFHYNAAGLHGEPRPISVGFNTPMFIGAGASYDGIKQWLFAVDLKYAFYEGMTGFYGDDAFFEPDGAIHGAGYSNALATTFGVQRKFGDKWSARLGYKYSTRVVPNLPTFELTSSALRHAVGGGFSFAVTSKIAVNAAYVESWAIPITGQMTSPVNNQPVPGSFGRLTLVEHAPSIGASVTF
jgi:long-chain fatty acid transport protein